MSRVSWGDTPFEDELQATKAKLAKVTAQRDILAEQLHQKDQVIENQRRDIKSLQSRVFRLEKEQHNGSPQEEQIKQKKKKTSADSVKAKDESVAFRSSMQVGSDP